MIAAVEPDDQPTEPFAFFVNMKSDGENMLNGDCTNCGAKNVPIMTHRCEPCVIYKDSLGHEYHVPFSQVDEFERRRRKLLIAKIVILTGILGTLLYWSWFHG